MSRRRYFENKFPEYNPSAAFERPKQDWQNDIVSLVQQIIQGGQQQQHSEGGLYVGNAGIAYMLYYVSQYEPLNQYKDSLLSTALGMIEAEIKQADKEKKDAKRVGFLLGPAGVYATAAMIGKALNNNSMVTENVQKYQSIFKTCLTKDFLRCGSDELFVGRAGYLCGIQALEKNLNTKIFGDDMINFLCQAMIESGRQYRHRHKLSAPLMYSYYDTEYIGPAHGISSILQTILCCPNLHSLGDANVNLVKSAVDWLLTTQQPNGNFVPSVDELHKPRPQEEELVHWCHGAPGVVYLLARAYQVWKDPTYLDACLKCGDLTWEKGLLRKGPGICHGVASSGYVFLLLYRLTQDKKHLYRAHKFAEFMFSDEFRQSARVPDCPFSLYEGWAGTVCFLVDLLRPEKAEFPFFSVI